jgi:cytochrome c-type biogenesis protein
MVLYGIAYAIASLSCTIAPFLAVMTSTFRAENVGAGVAVFVAYAVGMGLVVGVLAVAVALAQDGLVRRRRGVMRYVNRISGGLLVLAGTYVYYGLYELRLASRVITDDPVISAATSIQGAVAGFIADLGPLVLVVALVAFAALALFIRHRQSVHKLRDSPGASRNS